MAAAVDSLSIAVGIDQKTGRNAYRNPLPNSKNEIVNPKLSREGISNPYIKPAARSGNAVCKRRSILLSEWQPLPSIPAIPIKAGIISSAVTPRSENPERRFTKVGIQ